MKKDITPGEGCRGGVAENALLEHRPHLVCEPAVQFGAAAGVGDELNAEADFGEGHGADVELFERMRHHQAGS